jgi:D-glycero-alpha-D-manno-heptose-7-phosphate kinase
MIMTRTPLRISIGGGGTDLPSYYREFGGFVISAAINKYVYITVNRSFFPGYLLKYSEMEHVEDRSAIRHPLLREALEMHGVDTPLEIVSVADVPAGTGLGSSGSFTVGLMHALYAHRRQSASAEQLARHAIEVEMERLREPTGKQDQYIAAYGGLLCQEYEKDDSVGLKQLAMDDGGLMELRDSLMLFFVGRTRKASELLQEQKSRCESRDEEMLASLHFTKQLGQEIQRVLEDGRVFEYGGLLHEHWMSKRRRSKGMSNTGMDEIYCAARKTGRALGGKLVGAGGSGFFLFQTRDRKRLRDVMTGMGLSEMDFGFDFDGSVVLLRN